MQKAFKRDVKLKTGQVIPKGTIAEIMMVPENPMLVRLAGFGFDFKSASAKLYNKFSGFVNPYEEMKDEDFEYDCCNVPSLTGKNVEPDGYDDKGFPSVLLAVGLV